MDRLIAVNEETAVYIHDDAMDNFPVDPFAYINDLLQIRSAVGLVAFVKKYPHGLRKALPFRDARTEDRVLSLGGWIGRLRFSREAMKKAALRNDIQYLDEATDLGDNGDWYTRTIALAEAVTPFLETGHTPSPLERRRLYGLFERLHQANLNYIRIADLDYLQLSLENVLCMAAVAHGLAGSVEGAFTLRERPMHRHCNDDPLCEVVDSSLCSVTVDPELVAQMMPVPTEPGQVLDKAKNWFMREGNSALNYLPYGTSGQMEFLIDRGKRSRAEELCAGDLTAFALSCWTEEFTRLSEVTNTMHGFVRREPHYSSVFNELCDIVLEGRLGICPVCNRPFVCRSILREGPQAKVYCTDSCRVTANKVAKKGN